MKTLKIIVVSQKGGVGKSTLATNLAAWFCGPKSRRTLLLDFDPHGSSSSWVKSARPIGLAAEHHPIEESGARRWLFAARTHLRHATETHDVIVADLTWTPQVDGEFLLGFDLILVPTGVSEMELAATTAFIDKYRWVFSPADRAIVAPTLVVCPSRIRQEQVADHDLLGARFTVPFILSPPVFDDPLVRSLFRKDYLHAQEGEVSRQFWSFAQGVESAAEVHAVRLEKLPARALNKKPITVYSSVLSRYLAERTEASNEATVRGRCAAALRGEQEPTTTLNLVQKRPPLPARTVVATPSSKDASSGAQSSGGLRPILARFLGSL